MGVLAALVVACGLQISVPQTASAHGGYFLPPKPLSPPPPPPAVGRPKQSVPPPPPPPPSRGPAPGPQAPPTVRPRVPTPTPGSGPVTPPASTPLVTPTGPTITPRTTRGLDALRRRLRSPTRGRRLALSTNREEAWETWWALNRLGFLPDRTAGLRHAVVTPSEGEATAPETAWSRQRVMVAQRHVAPLLRRLASAEGEARDDVAASALLALAKVSGSPVDVGLIAGRMLDASAADLVRESAALAVGLLARSSSEHQLDGASLDRLRDQLLGVFDDGKAPYRTRVFAALSLGLLGNQPFDGPYAKDGRLVTRALWTRLESCEERQGLKVALLTAIGMQPDAGVPDGVREGLGRIVSGRRALRRRWDPVERSHAFAALLRLGGPSAHATLLRTVARKREHVAVRRAAYVAIGELAPGWTPNEREDVTRALQQALRKGRDPLTTGLGLLALGHLLGADLQAGALEVFKTGAPRELVAEARNGATPTRGFAALALALSVRNVQTGFVDVSRFLGEAQQTLLRGLVGGRGDDRMRGAYAVAVGLAGVQDALLPLIEVIEDRRANPELRGHAAVSAAWLGRRTPELQKALVVALTQRRWAELRRQAAMATALLGGRLAGTQLLKELDQGKTEQLLAQVVIALGRLGDLKAAAPLVAFAADDTRPELSQALAVVALGLLTDPEPRPTLLRLTHHANYPARTDALHEAFSIL